MVDLNVTGNRGMQLQTRPVEGVVLLTNGVPSAAQPTGRNGASMITAPEHQAASNDLLKPV